MIAKMKRWDNKWCHVLNLFVLFWSPEICTLLYVWQKKVKGVVFNNKVFMNFKFCYSGINKMEIIRRFFKIQKLSWVT